MSRISDRSVTSHLPLGPGAFGVLAALADGPQPGVAILERIKSAGPGRGIFGPGTLYRVLRDLRKQGLIRRTRAPAPSEDERRQYHSLTSLGQAVLAAELIRLRRMLGDAAWAQLRSVR